MLLERSDQAISSTDLQKNTRMLLDRLASGEQDRYVVFRDNKPAAVLLATETFERFMDELEDLRIEIAARDRLASFDRAQAITHADMLAEFGGEAASGGNDA